VSGVRSRPKTLHQEGVEPIRQKLKKFLFLRMWVKARQTGFKN
jgi:hypothetical protein